jgi:hypothetical protein
MLDHSGPVVIDEPRDQPAFNDFPVFHAELCARAIPPALQAADTNGFAAIKTGRAIGGPKERSALRTSPQAEQR